MLEVPELWGLWQIDKKFDVNLDYIVKLCLKKAKKINKP